MKSVHLENQAQLVSVLDRWLSFSVDAPSTTTIAMDDVSSSISPSQPPLLPFVPSTTSSSSTRIHFDLSDPRLLLCCLDLLGCSSVPCFTMVQGRPSRCYLGHRRPIAPIAVPRRRCRLCRPLELVLQKVFLPSLPRVVPE